MQQTQEQPHLRSDERAVPAIVAVLASLGLPERIEAQDKGIDALNGEIDALNGEIDSHKLMISSLKDRLGGLTSSLPAYKLLRNRFISTYKRDKPATDTEVDRRIIADGNGWGWVRGGDAVVDAPIVVQTISHHQPIIDVLNFHAKIAASKGKAGSERFYKLFADFVKLFKESGEGFEGGYLDGSSTDVTNAYRAFLNCINDEVTTIDADS